MERFVIIPTRAGLTPSLGELLDAVTAASAKPVIITNIGQNVDYPGAICVERRRQNFQHWGNLGLEYALNATANGADVFALIINDDIRIDPAQLDRIFDQAVHSDVISMDDRPPFTPWSPMTGWLFGVRPGKIWLDEAFTFWWGDDDLWVRATRDPQLRTKLVSAQYSHDRGGKGAWDPEFDAVATADRDLFFSRYPELTP